MSDDAKLFIGSLSWGTTDESLQSAFSGFGDVVEARARAAPSHFNRPPLVPGAPHLPPPVIDSPKPKPFCARLSSQRNWELPDVGPPARCLVLPA